jgi:integrase/recombinase XerD
MEVTMFTQLFVRDHRRYAESPVVYWLEGFASWLTAEEYSRSITRQHRNRLRQVLERCDSVTADSKFAVNLLPALFLSSTQQPAYTGTRRAFECFLAAHGNLVIEPNSERFSSILAGYREHLIDMRGLANATVRQHLATISEFLAHALPTGAALDMLSTQAVDAFLAVIGKRQARHSMQHIVAHLRAFLRYCHDRDEVRNRLDLIDSPRTYRGELPPRALAWPLVEALLRSIDCSNAMGCRDHAILFLMAHYGLRPSEIVALTLSSIDWVAGTLQVQQRKTHSELLLPLSDQALLVLKRYLRCARPESMHAKLFLRARTPAGPDLKHTAICDIYAKRARESALSLHGSSAYCLRHSFAMRLLNQGVGIKAIGDLLGHRTLESTCVYLRLQTEELRKVGLSVPKAKATSRARRST